jgi:RNA ligase (TIGR02306 family)
MERKLASLQRVGAIRPIENADRIEQATVLGWNVVVKKGEFQPDDLCVFFEIDSLLPEAEWSEFMRQLKFRVKTARLRGVLSQGLALTTAIIPQSQRDGLGEGDDVTAILGVTKYEPPQPTDMGDSAGPFPGYVPKTDEMRIQSVLPLLDEIRGRPYYMTVKCDGTSFTSVYDGEKLLVCSRGNMKRESDTDIYWRAARALGLPEKLKAHPRMAVQGELCGPGIEKNRLGLKDKQVFMFSVFDVQAGKYLNYADFVRFCEELSLPTVPLHSTGESFNFTLDDLLELARGKYDGTTNNREGIVIRPTHEAHSLTLGGRLSFKVLNNDFLLKDEE